MLIPPADMNEAARRLIAALLLELGGEALISEDVLQSVDTSRLEASADLGSMTVVVRYRKDEA